MKVVAFNGSPRREGNTSILINVVLEQLKKEGIDTELVHVGGKPLQGCTACYGCMKHKNSRCVLTEDMVNDCIGKMISADGIILGSPTYVADVTAQMKALMDRACLVTRANGELLQRKIGAAVVAMRRGGALHTLDSMNHFFGLSQMIMVGSSYWNFAVGRNIGDVHQDEEGLKTMVTLGQNMAWLLKKM